MPRLSEDLRAQRRRHVLTRAWACFSRNGFHPTTMDDVIAETGWSSSAVYRYVTGKDEIIEAAAHESLGRLDAVIAELLARDPLPGPAEALTALAAGLAAPPEETDAEAVAGYDRARLIVQSWAEGLRNPTIEATAGASYRSARDRLAGLARAWRDQGLISADADPADVAGGLLLVVPGLVLDRTLLGGAFTPGLLRAVAALSPVP